MAIYGHKLRKYRIAALLSAVSAAALGVLGAAAAHGASSPWAETDHGAVRLVAASSAVGSGETLRLGLHFRMKEGWKVYWRSPGDAGFPPQPSWAGSRNIESVAVDWPRPIRFDVLGLTTLGYKDEVVFPLSVKLFEAGKPVSVKATVPYLTCNDICVPYQAELALDLPTGGETNTVEGALIERFAALVPRKGGSHALAVTDARVEGPAGKQVLRVTAKLPARSSGAAAPELLIEGPPGFRFAPPRLETRGGQPVLLAAVSPPPLSVRDGAPADLSGTSLTLTLLTDDQAIEQKIIAQKGEATSRPSPPAPISLVAFLSLLGFAVLGGLILNLMPCVLPVLSLKMLSVIGHGGAEEKGPVRMGFLASAAGILTSFLVLASAAVALKAAGMAAGWGIQFQQPVFLILMAAIVALFAANLFGMFEIRLPGGLGDRAASIGQGHGNKQGLGSHFATGAFAALLATPCSAPFVGTAVGFALSRGAVEIYAIFAALGLGLALPYLLIAAVPSLATRLPRPGPWMITMKRLLGVALIATAIWLLTVLASQIGERAALLAASLIGAIFFVLWLLAGKSSLMSGGLVAALVLAALIGPSQISEKTAGAGVDLAQPYWKPFAPEAIAGHVAAGKTVFVDVTADWCVTCKVNKALVLDAADVVRRLRSDEIVAMRADWTRPDPVISAFLERFGRYGIPFNVVFGPTAPEGRPLPELLTIGAVTAAMDEAAGPRAVVRR